MAWCTNAAYNVGDDLWVEHLALHHQSNTGWAPRWVVGVDPWVGVGLHTHRRGDAQIPPRLEVAVVVGTPVGRRGRPRPRRLVVNCYYVKIAACRMSHCSVVGL